MTAVRIDDVPGGYEQQLEPQGGKSPRGSAGSLRKLSVDSNVSASLRSSFSESAGSAQLHGGIARLVASRGEGSGDGGVAPDSDAGSLLRRSSLV